MLILMQFTFTKNILWFMTFLISLMSFKLLTSDF